MSIPVSEMTIPIRERRMFSREEKNAIALRRAAELKQKIDDYLKQKELIQTGFDYQEMASITKKRMLDCYNATENEWNDWHWQMAHRLNDTSTLSELMGFSEGRCDQVRRVQMSCRWSISPYYASLMDVDEERDPIMMQSLPSIYELDEAGHTDPMAEEFTSPAPCVTRRYPDRLIINVTNQCAMYCRHCQRRRNIGEIDRHQTHLNLVAALEYVKANEEIRDVLITGGDALLLSDRKLDWLLGELDKIGHVEIKRIGTRALVTLPQ